MGDLRDLYDRVKGPVSAFAVVYCVMGVLTNVLGILHFTGTMEFELMAMAFEDRAAPSMQSFALTTAWWVLLSIGSGWAYLNAFRDDSQRVEHYGEP